MHVTLVHKRAGQRMHQASAPARLFLRFQRFEGLGELPSLYENHCLIHQRLRQHAHVAQFARQCLLLVQILE